MTRFDTLLWLFHSNAYRSVRAAREAACALNPFHVDGAMLRESLSVAMSPLIAPIDVSRHLKSP